MQITQGNLHAPCKQLLSTWPLHVTSPCDPCTWPLCSPTQFVELSRLNTSLQFCQSATSLERQKSVVSARDILRDFFRSRWAFLNQPSVFTRLTVLHKYVIYKWSKLRLKPLGLWRADSKNNTKSKKHFWAQIQSGHMPQHHDNRLHCQ